ncbi:nucleotidyltransferase family protein [Pseudopedobacter beijingensis]|uniref:NDP-sugar synthase n=1 Tax=Pseudopedobacter beijingensis TaxID=1207056 RepID=A0ABW4IG19_9SPHI
MNSEPTLLILAAGMASRYGSLKQVDSFGPSGETIIDYSIYDAIKAGFKKVAFIVKKDYHHEFKRIFDQKLAGKIETDYVFQDFDLKKFGINKEIIRQKPWGTGHALISAKDQINEPFCIINADDFYGYEAFGKMIDFLKNKVTDKNFALMGYEVDKTLSDYGKVSRGIFQTTEQGTMQEIIERTKVFRENGEIVFEEDGATHPIPENSYASMNFWGYTPAVFEKGIELFKEFVKHNDEENGTAEFYLPSIAEALIKEGDVSFSVLPTSSTWFGVTYKEDKPIVQKKLLALVEQGLYPESLWG